jgi:hypothetical protein
MLFLVPSESYNRKLVSDDLILCISLPRNRRFCLTSCLFRAILSTNTIATITSAAPIIVPIAMLAIAPAPRLHFEVGDNTTFKVDEENELTVSTPAHGSGFVTFEVTATIEPDTVLNSIRGTVTVCDGGLATTTTTLVEVLLREERITKEPQVMIDPETPPTKYVNPNPPKENDLTTRSVAPTFRTRGACKSRLPPMIVLPTT